MYIYSDPIGDPILEPILWRLNIYYGDLKLWRIYIYIYYRNLILETIYIYFGDLISRPNIIDLYIFICFYAKKAYL